MDEGIVDEDGRNQVGRGLRITDRDMHLFGVLSMARQLSTEQIGRLFYRGRCTVNLRKRLLAMAGEGRHGVKPAYLRRVSFRTYEGDRRNAWALTPLGFMFAERLLGEGVRPSMAEVGADFVQHALALNELLVSLLEAPLRTTAPRSRPTLYARATPLAFRWRSSDAVRLPWREYKLGYEDRDRVILPDAVLELPSRARRVFIECEMGTHPIRAASDEKQGATVNKAERYHRYITNFDHSRRGLTTFYAVQHPDGYRPEVLFLVPTETRRKAVAAALDQWQRKMDRSERQVVFHSLTLPLASANLLDSLAGQPSRRPIRAPTTDELATLREFYRSTVMTLKRIRAQARSRNEPPPDYPAQVQNLPTLLESLGGSA